MLSHRFKTIFVHIPKTGGQSIEHMFLKAHGLDWHTRDALLLRENRDASQGPARLAHMFAGEYHSFGHITREAFDEYYRFTTVRDPYDRIISEFNYRPHEHKTIRDFVASLPKNIRSDRRRHVLPQARFLMDEDEQLLVNDVLRFENLAEEIKKVFVRLPELGGELEHINSSRRKRMKRADLDAADIAFITELFEDDFRLLDYPKMA